MLVIFYLSIKIPRDLLIPEGCLCAFFRVCLNLLAYFVEGFARFEKCIIVSMDYFLGADGVDEGVEVVHFFLVGAEIASVNQRFIVFSSIR